VLRSEPIDVLELVGRMHRCAYDVFGEAQLDGMLIISDLAPGRVIFMQITFLPQGLQCRDASCAADDVIGVCVHAMRAIAATNALSNEADIAKAQEWLGHANVSTTRLYDRRKTRPEDSATIHVKY
jgi:integrase